MKGLFGNRGSELGEASTCLFAVVRKERMADRCYIILVIVRRNYVRYSDERYRSCHLKIPKILVSWILRRIMAFVSQYSPALLQYILTATTLEFDEKIV